MYNTHVSPDYATRTQICLILHIYCNPVIPHLIGGDFTTGLVKPDSCLKHFS